MRQRPPNPRKPKCDWNQKPGFLLDAGLVGDVFIASMIICAEIIGIPSEGCAGYEKAR